MDNGKPQPPFKAGETPTLINFMRGGCFVVVSENRTTREICGRPFFDSYGPLIFEQYLFSSDLESVRKFARTLAPRYGPVRIARLHFLENELIE